MGRHRKHNKNWPPHLQQRFGWFYYVRSVRGRVKWYPLRTRDLDKAREWWVKIENALEEKRKRLDLTDDNSVNKIATDDDQEVATVAQVLDEYWEKIEKAEREKKPIIKPKTKGEYKRFDALLRAQFGPSLVHRVRTPDLQKWLDQYEGTIYKYQRLRAFTHLIFEKARSWGYCSRNAMNDTRSLHSKEKKSPLHLTIDTLWNKLYPAAPTMMKRAIVLAFYLAQHEMEVKNMEWRMFDRENCMITFVRVKTNKEIPICYAHNDRFRLWVERTFAERQLCPWLIAKHNKRAGWSPYTSFRSMWRKTLESAGYDETAFDFKEIRHLSNSIMAARKVPVEKRCSVTGHSTWEANEKYTHDLGQNSMDALEVLGEYGPDKF